LKDWIGTILWKGKSSFRKLNKRQNWYVGLFELALEGSLDFDVNDVDFQTCKSSGPGGQHVNKRNSAVQAFHKPTGIRVQVSDSRSQIQNRKIAIERIQAKINEAKIDLILQQRSNKWKLNKELERGNPVRTFKGGDFKKVSKVKN
jgi:Protein chain release factor B